MSILYPSNLTVRNNVTHGYVKRILPMEKIPDNILQFYKKVKFEQKMMPLHGLDAIMVRRDPPIDSMVYNFLDSVKNEVVIINDIDGIRKANNKLYTTTFNDPNNSFLPITHVSKTRNTFVR